MSRDGVLLELVRWWACPSCDTVDRTQRADAHTQMHNCPGMNGLTAPLQEVSGPDAKPDAIHRLVEREEYIGTTGADPIMAIRTDRGDGSNDITVRPPMATVEGLI